MVTIKIHRKSITAKGFRLRRHQNVIQPFVVMAEGGSGFHAFVAVTWNALSARVLRFVDGMISFSIRTCYYYVENLICFQLLLPVFTVYCYVICL